MKRFVQFVGRAMWNELRVLVSFRPLLVMLIALPLVYPLAVSLLYKENTARERPAILIDTDNSALSRTFTIWIDATQDVKIVDRLSSVKEGWTRIRRHDAEMLIFIPDDFSTRIKKGRQAVYKVWVNSANIYTLGTSLPGLYKAAGTLNAAVTADFLMHKGVSSSSAIARAVPIVTDGRNLFLPFGGYGEFFAPGILMTVIQQMMLICLGFSVGYQKKKGIFKTDEPFLFFKLFAKLLVQSPFYIAAAAFIVYVVMPFSAWSVTDSGMCMMLFSALLITMAPFAMLTASMMKDHFAALEFMMFLSAPLFLMSGFTWPFERMPTYIQSIASVFPITPALQALRLVLTKSSQLSDLVPYFIWMGKLFIGYTLLCVVSLSIVSRRKTIARLFKKIRRDNRAKPLSGIACISNLNEVEP